MQSFAASSNALPTVSPATGAGQWRRSAEGHSPLTNIEMPRYPGFCRSGKVVDKWRYVPSALASMTPRPTYLDFNGGAVDEDTRSTNQCLEVEMQVRDSELDQYGVVNNAVYSRYCTHGHQELLKKVGLGVDEATTLSDLSLKFFAALRSGNRFVVKTMVSCISTTSIYVEDFIFKLPNRELILEAKATIVLMDGSCRPIHISPGVKANLLMVDLFDHCE